MVRSVPLRTLQTICVVVSFLALSNFFNNHVKIEIKTEVDWASFGGRLGDVYERDGVDTQEESVDNLGHLEKENISDKAVPINSTETKPPPYIPITCNRCFDRKYPFVNKPPPICNPNEDPPDLVAMVISTPRDHKQRNVIRQTYLRFAHNNNSPRFRYVFLLGAALTEQTANMINEESKIHQDILQQGFLESYRNLTLKTMMGLDYAVATCPKAKYVLKIDSDVFMNIPILMGLIDRTKIVTSIMGFCKWSNTPMRDKPKHKWHVPYGEFNQTRYPPLCEGPRYLIPMPVASAIVRVSPNVPFFRMEDVYVGMCLALTPFSVRPTLGFYNPQRFTGMQPEDLDCYAIRRMMSTHKTSADEMKMIWDTCFQGISLDLPRS